MRALLCLAILPLPALAEDFVLPTAVTDAVIYPSGAELVRSGSLELPAGSHRILLPLPPVDGMIGAPRLEAEGVSLGAVSAVDTLPIAADDLLTDAQREADAVLTAAEARLNAARDAAAEIEGEVRAAEARLSFLRSVSMPESFEAGVDIGAAVAGLADTVAGQTAAATEEIVRLSGALRAARERLEEAEAEAARARRALDELGPLGESPGGLVATVNVPAPTTVALSVTYLTAGVSWEPEYELRLDSESETLTVTRLAGLRQFTGETWTDVSLSLSTADPGRGAQPTEVRPDPAVLIDEVASAPGRVVVMEDAAIEGFAERSMPAPAPTVAAAVSYGLSLRYDYPDPVRVSGGGQRSVLLLGTIEMAPDLSNVAAPRFDGTAYLLAEARNGSGETLLPGAAAIYRDGDFVGRMGMEQWADGEEREIAFGPVDTIQLDWTVLRREAGDAGLISRSDTREVRARFTVTNTGDEEAEVRALYALPFSEDEDLDVGVSTDPRPSATDLDGMRGVSAWDLTVPPGGEAIVTLRFDLDWPEGQTLIWQP